METPRPNRWSLLLAGILLWLALPLLTAAEPKPAPGITATNDPVEAAFQRLMRQDDEAGTEVDRWIRDADAFEAAGAGGARDNLAAKIRQRMDIVDQAYRNFLELHPNHAGAHLAYGSFRNDLKDEDKAREHWEKARELDPKNPAAWNNLANYYGHRSPVTNSFVYYAEAMRLNPTEPVYVWNLATTVYLFRKDAMEFYGIDETGVFDKSLDLYRKAVALDPKNFILLSDYANSYYGTKPPRHEDGLRAWGEALKIAGDAVEREGVRIHLARLNINLKRYDEARAQLDQVTDPMYARIKARFTERIAEELATDAAGTNTPAATPSPGAAPVN